MVEIIVGEKVINKTGEKGTIISVEGNYINVNYGSRVATLQLKAFELGFLTYENEELQRKLLESIEQAKNEDERKLKEVLFADAEKVNQEIKPKKADGAKIMTDINNMSVSVNLRALGVDLSSVKTTDQELVHSIFYECDKDIQTLYDLFKPKMEYNKFTSRSRSKYSVGFLTKHLDTYVLRVFARNDIYKKRITTGVTIIQIDSTEIFRIVCINGKVYYFSKNLSSSSGYFNISRRFNRWVNSLWMAKGVILNEVIRKADCGYLNDYIIEKNINCNQYAKLLFPALNNNKVEIVFKNKLFLETYQITDLAEYLEEFSSNQIDFACKNNVINTLPIIKKYGIRDIDILQDMDKIMKKQRHDRGIYDFLVDSFKRLNFDYTDIDRRLISFIKKVDDFNAGLYFDYIYEISTRHDVIIGDFFDKNYVERHEILMEEKRVGCDKETIDKYKKVAKELSWIDREENGYFILVPKTIDEFIYEGKIQHNCVYTRRYFNSVIARQSIIVFLREEKYTPYVTIEFDYETFDVLQAYGKYNKEIDKELDKYIVYLGKKINFEMLSQ